MHERDNPVVGGSDRHQMPGGGRNWAYRQSLYNAVSSYTDNYEEHYGAAIGQRVGILDVSGQVTTSLDLRGRPVTQVRAISSAGTYTTSYGYDAADRVITATYPTGEVITSAYNAAGLLAGVRSQTNGQWYASGVTYNAAGQLTGLTYGNQTQAAYTYRTDNLRLERIQVGGSLLDMRYAYDPVGNVRTITDTSNSGQVLTFTYDALDRLTRGYTSGGGLGTYDQSFSYNAIGNLTSMAGTSQWYSDTNHVHAATHLSGTRALWYDANGNTITRTVAGVTHRLAWDAENRLSSVTQGGVTTTFTYDGNGSRVKVAVGTSSPPMWVTPTRSTSQRATTTYYYLGAQRIAMRTSQGVTYLAGDHLGSSSLAMGSSNVPAILSLWCHTPEPRRRSNGTTSSRGRSWTRSPGCTIMAPGSTTRWWGGSSARIPSCRARQSADLNRYAYTRTTQCGTRILVGNSG